MRDDYYQLLDAEPAMSAEELKRAYHRQAKRFHPDHNAGDAAAAERFKLVAEAWRVLGNAEKRAVYDAALRHGNRADLAPELATMPHHARVSRHARERRRKERHEHYSSRDCERRKPRFFLVSHRKPLKGWAMVGVYVLFLLMVLPPIINVMHPVTLPPAVRSKPESAPKEEKKLPDEVVRERLLRQAEEIRAAAEAGDAAAQMRYGFMLYVGSGIPQDRLAAREWWERSAAAGNTAAATYLSRWTENPPAAEAPAEEHRPEEAESSEPDRG